ncbi:ABC transporter ATP-binding protein [Mesoaciditoga lauensis]|uniref:ABC transporter ATP-binding protein n=1 Tax=Mesoaciditoga lauensis TaxID=1495039 RepID=UPI00055ACEBA|nr:ABC transporter ATP-binding protein [Mesoaciditoga lauensis]
MKTIVELESVTKKFGKIIAVSEVNLSIQDGEIHSVIGENGAGKTTLMRILYGMYKPDRGRIKVAGESVKFSSPKDAIFKGIGMVHQNFMLIDTFTVYENVVLGSEPKKGIKFDRKKAKEKVKELAAMYKMNLDVDEKVGRLSVGLQQKVEILKLLYRNAKILIFDEPTAVLTPHESEILFEILKRFKKNSKTVIFISHKLKEVKEISDRITVMRNGRNLGTFENKNLSEEKLAEMIAGRKLSHFSPPTVEVGKTALKVKDVSFIKNGISVLKNVNLEIREGEIVGIAGVVGNGQSELEEIVSGMTIPTSGKVFFYGEEITNLSVRKRREKGMVYIPEDRIKTGLAPLASIEENMLMGHQNKKQFLGKMALLKRKNIKEFTTSLVKNYDIVCKSPNEQAGTLSGGNMQKVVIAREFSHDARFLVISQPTRGVDVGAIEFVHKRIMEMKKKGIAILLISSDLDEIFALSDKIVVMYEGRINYVTSRENAQPTEIGLAMLGMRK